MKRKHQLALAHATTPGPLAVSALGTTTAGDTHARLGTVICTDMRVKHDENDSSLPYRFIEWPLVVFRRIVRAQTGRPPRSVRSRRLYRTKLF